MRVGLSHEITSVSWGVFLTADGAVTLAHMGLGSFKDAVATFNDLTPEYAEAYAEDVRSDIGGGDDSALSVTLGLPDHWVGGTTEWGWIITRATS